MVNGSSGHLNAYGQALRRQLEEAANAPVAWVLPP